MKKKYFINANIIDPHNSLNENGGLIIDEIGDSTATQQSATWGSLVASVGDIIQYNTSESRWQKVFDASNPDSTLHYVTNSNTGIQYRFTGTEWVKSYEGIYKQGTWTIVLDGGFVGNDDASGQDATTP